MKIQNIGKERERERERERAWQMFTFNIISCLALEICVPWLVGGGTDLDHDLSEVLQKVTVPIISNSECKQYYEEEVFPSMICTGGQESGKETCRVKSLSLNSNTIVG